MMNYQRQPGESLAVIQNSKLKIQNLSFWLALFLFSIYLLSFSGRFHVMDELAVFTAGHNLATSGRADINQLIWTNHWTPNPPGVWGSDGNLYTKKAPGISFVTAPLIWLGAALPGLNAAHVALLANAAVTALTAALLLVWLTDLGFSPAGAGLAGLVYGLGTFAWVYARMFWESSLLALCFLVALWAAWRATRPKGRQLAWLALAGLALALGLTLRFETVPAFVLIGLYVGAGGWGSGVRERRPEAGEPGTPVPGPWPLTLRLTLYALPSLLAGVGLLYFNWLRFGSLSETGYSQEILFQAPWVGGWGLLFSPGIGLFFYAPLLWLLPFGLRPARRRLGRAYFWLLAGLCLFYWLFYGSWFAWGGTWGWGPRFLLVILPLLMVFMAEVTERVSESANQRRAKGEGRRVNEGQSWTTDYATRNTQHVSGFTACTRFLGISVLRFTFYPLFLLSLLVNLLGLLVDFNEHFLRLNRNDDFVFNWAHFPPLAHWQILQEGLVDLIWLRPGPTGALIVDWAILAPALALVALAATGLVITWRRGAGERGSRGAGE